MKLETERLILRHWQEDDAKSLYRYAKDPLVGPAAGWKPHESVAESRTIIQTVFNGNEIFAVTLKETGEPVGCIGITPSRCKPLAEGSMELEIGYWIGVPYWGQGLIPEAVRRIQEIAFADGVCDVLWSAHYDGNIKSRRVQEKCGFVYHHTEYNVDCPALHEKRTEHFMYMTKDMWKKSLALQKEV